MNILLLAKKPPYPSRDGESIAVMQMARGFANHGHQVTILYQNTDKHHFPVEDIPAEDADGIRFEAVSIHARISTAGIIKNLFTSEPYHVQRFRSHAYQEKVRALTDTQHFDIIQAEGLYLVQYLLRLPKKNNTLYIYRSHNLEHEIWQNVADNSTNPLKKLYLRMQAGRLRSYEVALLKGGIDGVVPISTADALYYKQVAPALPVHHAPTGMETGDPATAVRGKGLYFIGGLDWLPNREGLRWFMEEIWPIVYKAMPQLQLEIAGRNAPDDFASDLPEGIFFNGEVPDANAFALEKAICVVPLLSGSGMKIKIVEALAAGKAVVTTSKGAKGMPEGMDAHLHIADTPADFAALIIRLAGDPDATHEKGMLGQQYVMHTLANSAIAGRLIQFYQTLQRR